MKIEDLMNYQITSIRTPISATSFAIPFGIIDAGEYLRVANIGLVRKEDIRDIYLEDGKLIIRRRDDEIIAMTFAEEEILTK
ncbi:MAG: hypothetical protein MJ127_05325 [Mogibacterium sp.]|nr:hypothetical protein [Mogibacterium sp.]